MVYLVIGPSFKNVHLVSRKQMACLQLRNCTQQVNIKTIKKRVYNLFDIVHGKIICASLTSAYAALSIKAFCHVS